MSPRVELQPLSPKGIMGTLRSKLNVLALVCQIANVSQSAAAVEGRGLILCLPCDRGHSGDDPAAP